MNNDPVYQKLCEIAWRRKLTEAEQAELRSWLAAHPEAAAGHDLESALSDALVRLPDVPVPSNFTSRVLQAIEREEQQPTPRSRDWACVWRVLVPRTAAAMLVLGVAGMGAHRFQVKQRTAIRNSLVTIATVPSMPSAQALEDFDAVRELDSADTELIALLQ